MGTNAGNSPKVHDDLNKQIRSDYLLECYRSACEELRFRVKHRDHWINIQLISQATLLALFYGIGVSNVQVSKPVIHSCGLATPIAFIILCLYIIQDGVVMHSFGYLRGISSQFSFSGGAEKVENPYQLRNDDGIQRMGLWVISLFFCFFLIPFSLFIIWRYYIENWTIVENVILYINYFSLFTIFLVLLISFRFRYTVYKSSSSK